VSAGGGGSGGGHHHLAASGLPVHAEVGAGDGGDAGDGVL